MNQAPPVTEHNSDHEYLGDGVYVSHDGYHVWLDLRAQDSTTAVALEPDVFKRLVAYRERIVNAAKAAQPTEG